MRGVTRLRTLAFRSWMMPMLVAAMACRALAPAGIMTAADTPSAVASTLCSLEQNRRERLEFPVRQQQQTPRCDHCLNGPTGWAPIALLHLGFTPFISPLSQSPRAPPHA
jgi:hypothetical protein